MWCVDRPPFNAEQTLAKCIGNVNDKALKRRLENVAGFIASAADDYAQLAGTAELHLMPSSIGVAGEITTDEMVDVYDYRMAKKKAPGRHIYDAIKLLPKHGICPYCDHRPVSTLDHLLPKRLFPALSVAPDNLIGACADCNKAKLDFAPTSAEEVIIHPYFDNVEIERWLAAQVVNSPVAAVVFRTRPVARWPDVLNKRIRRQFNMMGLSRLYGAQAAREISSQTHLLGKVYDSRGPDGVRDELIRQADTREAIRLNSWQAVTYRTLSESDWFCDGGFRSA